MKKTNIYGFGYLEPGDLTSELLDMDQRRFLAIENNVQHLYTIFGNGVLEESGATDPSWEIQFSTNTSAQVQISKGQGHVAWKYLKTDNPTTLSLPVVSYPSKFWIYATTNETSPELGTVTFVASLVEINNPNYYVGLGAVTISSGENGLSYTINNDATNGRVVINLFNTLASRVNAHKHIGGTRNPSPIDLSAHVQGKLSGDFISDLDASKITKGVLAPERLPQIDHNNLSSKGTLTHSEIDSLLSDLTYPTGSRLSDLFVANMLQLTLALKKQTGLGEIDKNLVNVIMYQPGYNADDSFVSYYSDWDAETDLTNVNSEIYVPGDISLAEIDKVGHRIIGGNPSTISSDNVYWRTDIDFQREYESTYTLTGGNNSKFIEIVGTDDPAYFILSRPYRFINLSNPELSSYTPIFPTSRGWTFAEFGELNNTQTGTFRFTDFYQVKYFRDSSNNNVTYDFTGVDKLAISYAISNANSDVYLFLLLSSGGTSVVFDKTNNAKTINKSTEVTLYTLDSDNSEEDIKSFNIDAFLSTFTEAQKQQIVGFGFRWRDDNNLIIQLKDADLNSNSSKLTLEGFKRAQQARINGIPEEEIPASPDSSVFVWNEKFYSETGQLVIRFNDSSGNPNFTNVIEEVRNEINGATVRFFTRVASSEANLNNAAFYEINTDNTISSQNSKGSWIDIKVVLAPSTDRLASPVVDKVGLSYIRAGVASDKYWDTRYQFTNQGLTFNNLGVVTNTSPFGAGETLTGTLQFVSGSANVSGTGTAFASEVAVGDVLYYLTGTALGTVSSITNNTNLVLTSNAGVSYTGSVFLSNGNTDFLQLSDSSKVGAYKFLKHDTSGISTYYEASNEEVEISFGIAFSTPYQVWNKTNLNGLQKARDAYIMPNNHVVFADTQNDRVIEVDEAGEFVRAIQGNVRLKRNVRDFAALTAYYNEDFSTLYICFSQYLLINDQAKINIQSADQIISFDNTGRNADDQVTVSLFSPVSWSSGAGNGANIPTTAAYQGQKSATIQVVFKGATKTQVESWPVNDIYVNIEDGAVSWNGNDGIAYDTSSGGSTTDYGSELPSYLTSPKNLFKNVGGTGEFQSQEFVAFQGLIPDDIVVVDGDFNNDGILPEGTTTTDDTLMGPDGQTPVKVKVFVGKVAMDNLFSPISVQVIEQDQWVVAACGAYSVNRYDSLGSNISRFQIGIDKVKFIEGKGGSAYLMNNGIDLNNRNLLVAAPAQSGNDGRVLIINQISNQSTATNTIPVSFATLGLDAIRALPDQDGLHYWVLLDDVVTNGLSSKVVKFDSSGNIKLEWGSGEQNLNHPVGLQFTENGDLLISE
jgi:hypothetical protein